MIIDELIARLQFLFNFTNIPALVIVSRRRSAYVAVRLSKFNFAAVATTIFFISLCDRVLGVIAHEVDRNDYDFVVDKCAEDEQYECSQLRPVEYLLTHDQLK